MPVRHGTFGLVASGPLWVIAAAAVAGLLLGAAAVTVLVRRAALERRHFTTVARWYGEYQQERFRDQAALVCAWPVSERETFQKVIERGVVGSAVRNASQAPVYDVELVYADPPAAWTAMKTIPMVAPSEEPQVFAGFDTEKTEGTPSPERVNADGSISLAPSAFMEVEIRFRDGQGRRWSRNPQGVLTLLGDSAEGV